MTSRQEETTAAQKEHPLVSVIVANYNYARFLPQAIASVFNQTYRRFELIIVDDGSTDNSREIITSYGEKVKTVFQENAGQGAAFNAGIACSQGEIICFLDADDYFYPDKIAKVVTAFLEHPQWVQISHGRTSVNTEGIPIGTGSTVHNQGNVQHLLLRWGRYAMAITSALAYRRSAIEKVLPIPTERGEAADTYLAAAVPFYGEVGSIDEPLMYYRMHGNNLQARNDNIYFLMRQRELNATYINRTAARLEIKERLDLHRDADYRSLKAIEAGGVSLIEAIQIIWLSWRESTAVGRSFKDTLERLLRRGICALFPTQGKAVLGLGLRGYARTKLLKPKSKPSSVS